MCGIFGMIGANAVANTLQALKYLEYRGYDSAGIAAKQADGIRIYKSEGRIHNLEKLLKNSVENNADSSFSGTSGAGYVESEIAIGHTRWATHGAVTTANAHPFYSPDGNFAVVHNGIIENYLALKKQFTSRGAVFTSETDSETVAYLLQNNYNGNTLQAVCATAKSLVGAFAIAVTTTYDNSLYAIKNKSPLVIGVSDVGVYLCSDIRCVSHWATKVAVTPDNTVVVVGKEGVRFYDFEGKPITVRFFTTDAAEEMEQVDGDFMLKEIFEIPEKIRLTQEGYFKNGGFGVEPERVRNISRIYLIGCGTAYNSGLQIAAVARKFLDVDVLPVIASEFIYDNYPVDGNTLAFFISQSGETADTIRAAENFNSLGGYSYAVTNTKASSLCFACKKVAYIYAGGEFAVASTKAYNCQLVTLLLLTLDVGRIRGTVSNEQYASVLRALTGIPSVIEEVLSHSYEISRIAETVKDSSAVFYIGRTTDYPTACEGSLKLKEISYIHSEAYPAGELKHGTLALMEENVTVVAITDGTLSDKMASSINEVATRGAKVISVSPQTFPNALSVTLPKVNTLLYGIVSVVPLQLLAYYVAKRLGRDVDKPRNLAKSVTVE
ncbi:MAG: glutamine--fructose-6-phosphate transaminase (isomerizing) [Clostridiales bacterium]|nr:glutamine--fructose-6-phosphate transaminase (isomerizing) [Clostridiales bacterium]